MRIALPVDTQNYMKRLENGPLSELVSRYGVTDLDVIPWSPRDFDSYGGKTESFNNSMIEIGRMIKGSGLRTVTIRISYFNTAHPGAIKWTNNRRGFRYSPNGIKTTSDEITTTFRGLAILKDASQVDFQPAVSYHDQCEMELTGGISELVERKKELVEMTYENADTLFDLGNSIFKKGGFTLMMENTSWNKEAKPPEKFRDEVAYIAAEEFKPLLEKGVKAKLDAGHAVLQTVAIDEWEKGIRPLEKRLEILKAEYGEAFPRSLMSVPQNGKYDLAQFVSVLGNENIVSVDVTQVTGFEEHAKPLGITGGLINYNSLKSQLRSDVVWVPEVGGSHKDPEQGINLDLLEALDTINSF